MPVCTKVRLKCVRFIRGIYVKCEAVLGDEWHVRRLHPLNNYLIIHSE